MKAIPGFPHPYLSLTIAAVWLLMNNSLSGGTLVLGLILGWMVPLITRSLWPDPPALKRPWKLAPYLLRVIVDIIIGSIQVARLVLNFRRQPQSAFVSYPLTLEHPLAITILASTISLTPGTVSADISADHTLLLIHALDVDDEEELVNSIRNRYEKPLREIFQ